MKKFAMIAALAIAAVSLTGCGERVEVPTGYVGKVMTPEGFEESTRGPSTFRLPVTPPWGARYRLVLVEASDRPITENVVVFMPKDRLNLSFDIRMTFSIPSDNRVGFIFDRLSPPGDKRTIQAEQVYNTYVQPVVRDVARIVAARHTITEILTQRDAVAAEMQAAVAEALKDRPVIVANIGFGDVQPPDVIVRAESLAKEREIALKKAEADRLVAMTEADTRKEVALRQQEIDMIEAETQAKVDKVLAAAVNPAFVTQRSLKALESLVQSNNRIIFMPMEAMRNPALLIGALQKPEDEPVAEAVSR